MATKSAKTLDQRRSNAVFSASQPTPGPLYQDQRKRYVDAAKNIEKTATGIEGTVYDLFGPEFIGSLALALDPFQDFNFDSGLISYWNRDRVEHHGAYDNIPIRRVGHRWYHLRNYIIDEPTPIPEYLVEEYADPIIETTGYVAYNEDSIISDTTNRTRTQFSYNYPGFTTPSVPFGMMKMSKFSYDDETPEEMSRYVTAKTTAYSNPSLYDIESDIDYVAYSGTNTIAAPSSPPLSDRLDMEEFAWDFLNKEIIGLIPKATASKRLFNSFYQITELKDLPQTIEGVLQLKDLLGGRLSAQELRNPKLSPIGIGANQYLNYQFGLASIYQALDGFLKLPARATKRLNYLIRNNGKVVTGRHIEKYPGATPPSDSPPSFDYDLPDWLHVKSATTRHTFDVEVRLAINQQIRFPELAVPEFSDTNYRDLLGLNPTAADIYNIIPWTWLVDYFVDLGGYIDCMDAINSDRQIINYGFATFVSLESLIHEFVLGATNSYTSYDIHGGVAEEVYTENVYPCKRTYQRKFQQRVDISYLDGVKTYGKNWVQNLNPFQYSILGALIAKGS